MAQVTVQHEAPPVPAIAVRNTVGDAGDIRVSLPPPGRPPRSPLPPSRPAARATTAPPEDMEEALREFANPAKVRSATPSPESRDDDDDFDRTPESEYSDPDDDNDAHHAPGPFPRYAAPPEETPSSGFLTIEDEKADILFKLQRLKKQGVCSGRVFGMHNDVREMRAELTRIKTELELERSLKFSRKALVGMSSALEFFNDKIDILDLELDGWSEHMHQSVYSNKEYDDVLEELFYKYRGKVSMPPEVRLIMAVGGSALQFHITKLAIKSHSQKTARSAAEARRLAMGPPPDPPSDAPRPEMRGPPKFPAMPTPGAPSEFPGFLPVMMADPQPSRDPKPVPQATFAPPPPPRSETSDESERLSDVPSDLESLPSRMSSPDESPPPAKKRRGGSNKKVIEI